MIYENDTRLHPSKLGLISALMYYRPLDVYAWYRNFNTVFRNDLESDAAILAWALGSIPSYESYLPKELAYLEGDWIYKLEGLGNRLRSDTVIGMEAVYNCLEGLEGSGEVGVKMREIRYDGQRILNTLQMIDEKYAKWNKAQVWEELENKLIQLN